MKKILALSALTALAGNAFAQSQDPVVTFQETGGKYEVVTNRFWDNWFLTFGVGGQTYLGDHNKQMSLGKQITPAFELGVGKWFTPGMGLRLMYSGNSIKGVTQNGSYSTGKVFDAKQALEYQKFNFGQFQADVMLDMTNLFCGYNPDRVYSAIPYAGIGLMHSWDKPRTKEISATLGFMNSFHVSSSVDLNLDIRGSMVNDRFDGEEGNRKYEGLLSATVGMTYKFKQRGWKKPRTKTLKYYFNDELNEMRGKLKETEQDLSTLSDENTRLKEELSKAPTIIDNTDVEIPKQITVFALGTSTLSKDARINLGFYAKIIMANPTKRYAITGFADRSTGTAEINDRISRARAKAVHDCLVNEFKVPASILTIHSMGGVEDMFYNDAAMSRAVIIEVDKK